MPLELYTAVAVDNRKLAEFLIRKGADPNITDPRNGKTLLHEACLRKYAGMAKLLIENGANVNAVYFSDSKETPLTLSYKNGDIETVKLLLERGADSNIIDFRNGKTLLHKACSTGYAEMAKLLIEKGANVDAVTYSKETPLHLASYGFTEVVKLLIDNNANINAANSQNAVSLLWACMGGHSEIAKLLIENGADVNIVDKLGETPLYWAASKGLTEIVELLLQKEADVNVVRTGEATGEDEDEGEIEEDDEIGTTPLYKAFTNGHIEIAKLLILHIFLENPVEEKPSFMQQHEALSNYWDTSLLEVNKLLNYFAHKPISCSAEEFLTKNPSKLAENFILKNINELIQATDDSEFSEKFPNYARLIKTRLEKLERLVKERFACLALSDKFHIISKDGKVALDGDTQRKILSYLPTSDIKKVLRVSLFCPVESDSATTTYSTIQNKAILSK